MSREGTAWQTPKGSTLCSFRAPMQCCRGQSVLEYFLAAIDKTRSDRAELLRPKCVPPAPGTCVNHSKVHNRYMQVMCNNVQQK
jgi:hypothetical protein